MNAHRERGPRNSDAGLASEIKILSSRHGSKKSRPSRASFFKKPWVGIAMGSDSDLPVMQEAAKLLEAFGISCEVTITSAHRSPHKTLRYIEESEKNGVELFIIGAGGAAHLAGVVAAHSTLPVIGVPMESPSLKGMDSLLSTVQMPSGVPVATMAIGAAGAKNAAILAVQILAKRYPELKEKLRRYKTQLAQDVESKNQKIRQKSHTS
jgi:phosphoribosylaminoimidazole carboxylase PurE protein